MDCSYVNCSRAAQKQCECGNIRKMFCSQHFDEHIKDHSGHHTSNTNLGNPSTSTEVVINYLLSLKVQAREFYKANLDDLIKIHEAIQKKSLNSIKELDTFSREIDSLVDNIKNHKFNLSEGRLAQSLKMPVDQALKETKKWVLIKNELNVESLIKSISDVKGISNELFLLYEDDTGSNRMESSTNLPLNTSRSNDSAIDKSGPNQNYRNSVPARALTASEAVKPGVIPRCLKNHNLVFNNTIHFTYWEQKKCYMITCNTCNKKVTEATWNCLECNYDICRSCAKIRNYNTPVLECHQKHDLKWRCDYMGLQSTNYNCSGCKTVISQGPRWNCKTCDFNKCVECGAKAGFKPFLSRPKCLKYHKLKTINIIFKESELKYCKICKDPAVGNNLTCSTCKDLFCLECSPRLREPTAGHPVAACNSGDMVLWQEGNYPCSYCKEVSNLGFLCVPCKFKICLSCCNFLIEVVSKPISKALNDLPLTWYPRCTEFSLVKKQVFCCICLEDIQQNGYFRTTSDKSEVCLLCFRNPERVKRGRYVNPGQDILNILMLSRY